MRTTFVQDPTRVHLTWELNAAGRLRRARIGWSLLPQFKVLFLVAVLCCLVSLVKGERGGRSSDTIVITQEDLDAFARAPATTPSAVIEFVETRPRAEEFPVRFDICHSFPSREWIYWEWLESGALGLIARIESEIADRRAEHRELASLRDWSPQLQRELDSIDDEIEQLETEREHTLLERVAQLELTPGLSPYERTEAAVLCMTVTLIDLDDGKAKQALKVLDRARAHLQDEPLVSVLRGIVLREVGRSDAARDEFRNALANRSGMLLALIGLAEALEDDLDYAEAAELWDRARRADLGFPRGLERLANRDPERFPEGEASLRRLWSDYLLQRVRQARLRDFAHSYYLSHEKTDYTLIYDPSIGVPWSEEYAAPLRAVVERYLEGGEEAVDRREVERLFRALSLERDQEGFQQFMLHVSDFLATAERDVGRALGHRARETPVVVVYNPNVWQALIAGRGIAGLFAPHGRSVSVYVTPGMNPDDLKSTIYHEYGHFATFDLAGPRDLPVWLVEGLAEHLARESGYDRFAEDSVLARWRDIWVKERIARPWFNKGRESFGPADYYKARRAVGLLAARFGLSGLGDMLEALGDGADLDEASRRAFEMDYRDLLRFLVKRLPSWTGR